VHKKTYVFFVNTKTRRSASLVIPQHPEFSSTPVAWKANFLLTMWLQAP